MKKETIEIDTSSEKERLIRELKKHVKQVMEESVAKKIVHEESSNVSAICSTLDTCLALGLRRRSLGLFKTSSTVALLQKISKENDDAQAVVKKIEDLEKSGEGINSGRRKSSSSSDSIKSVCNSKSLQKFDSVTGFISSASNRFYWIRIALFEKKLHKIVNYLVNHADKFYEWKRSLVGDPDYGPILESLLVGPCALEYSKAIFTDQYWLDPPADELVQRHRISSFNNKSSLPSTPSRHGLKRMISTQIDQEERRNSLSLQARDYVESLHQNRKTALLYGKNNILVAPNEKTESLPGYLSLHQDLTSSVILKWTPNSLMDSRSPVPEIFSPGPHSPKGLPTWELAIQINMGSILYIHCHKDADGGGSLVMVGVDGVQYPPISFPPGESLTSFLCCLESAILEQGDISPSVATLSQEKEAKQSNSRRGSKQERSSETDEPAASTGQPKDVVFKISYLDKRDEQENGREFLHKARSIEWLTNFFNKSKKAQSLPSSDSFSISEKLSDQESSEGNSGDTKFGLTLKINDHEDSCEKLKLSPSVPLKGLCSTMRSQLVSRAFYGWLSHCRHMRLIRTHLHDLVVKDFEIFDNDGEPMLSIDAWKAFKEEGLCKEDVQRRIYRSIFNGGIDPSLRREVWPYILEYLDWSDTDQSRIGKDGVTLSDYESKISQWGALEAIVVQQDREIAAANIARLSQNSRPPDPPTGLEIQTQLSNTSHTSDEVFENNAESDQDYGESPTPDRPSTITEVTEHSSRSISRSKMTSESSSSSTQLSMENKRIDLRVPAGHISASDEGIEDLNDEDITDEARTPAISTNIQFGLKITTPSIDSGNPDASPPGMKLHLEDDISIGRRHSEDLSSSYSREIQEITRKISSLSSDFRDDLQVPMSSSTCPSPASSEGGTYSLDLLDNFGLNLHRIDKDVARCDRNHPYFSNHSNLEKLRNIITTYVWENLEIGYMQGMCDLVAPLLVVLDDEAIVYECFKNLMKKLIKNFPTGDQMDLNFHSLRALMQVLDSSLYDRIQESGDFSHFYFCYRWFLLDFKREFDYSSVYTVWETIWTAHKIVSPQFNLFIALGLVETYRDIILDRQMDFTDIIKFFNEMAERHDVKAVIQEAKQLMERLQVLVNQL